MSRYGHLELLTPPNDGCILNGMTRRTIVEMKDQIKAKFNCSVEERKISIHELISSHKEQRLVSMFGVSTHCPLLPIKRVVYKNVSIDIAPSRFTNDLDTMLEDCMRADPGNNPWVTQME